MPPPSQVQLFHTMTFDRPNTKRIILRGNSKKGGQQRSHVISVDAGGDGIYFARLICFLRCKYNNRWKSVAYIRWYERGAVEPVTGCTAAKDGRMRDTQHRSRHVYHYDCIRLSSIRDAECLRKHPKREGWYLVNRFACFQ